MQCKFDGVSKPLSGRDGPVCNGASLQVKLLVGEDEFARYDRLLLQNSLDLMADVVYCPRASCCMAVMLEPNATMGLCPSCRYAFCTLCKRAYHGLSHCMPTVGKPLPLSGSVFIIRVQLLK